MSLGGRGSRSIPRVLSAVALSAFGLFLAFAHGYHILTDDTALIGTVLGGAIPLVLAIAVVTAGPVLYRSRLDRNAVTTTVAWGYIGGLTLACVALLIVAHQAAKGEPLHGPIYTVASAATGGAIVGTVAGRFDALNRQKADLISSLQTASVTLSTATTREEVCRRAVDIANRVLDIPLTGIWLYDESRPALVPAAIADPAKATFEEAPTYRPGEGLSWEAFESGTVQRYDDVSTEAARVNSETVIRSEIIVPLGEIGVMNFGSMEPKRFDSLDETVAELLGAATEAALIRADREGELRKQRQLLERQNERLEEFTSIVSHDLRNPLSVAQGWIELARSENDADELESAATALDDMERLIDDLLSLAKQGQTVGETEPVSLAAAAEEAWQNVDAEPATLDAEAIELDADPDRLRQLLENLFKNAVEHGGSSVSIRAGPLSDDPGFFVSDDGRGIPADDRERIFEVGYTDHEDGTGFGLSIVRRIADAHGWLTRAIESESGGARFEFRFDEDL